MASIHLGSHFEKFIEDQIARGRFQNASEVVRAGLRLLEEHEMDYAARRAAALAGIDENLKTTHPDMPAEEVSRRLEALHAELVKRIGNGS